MEKRLYKFLTKLGLTCVFADNCLYTKKEKGKIILIILVYADDMVVVALESIHIVSFKMAFSNNFDITDLGKLKFMLEIFVTHNYTN